jgi:hypothetical protein
MAKSVIDLGRYVTSGVTVLAGRERGEEARSALDLDRKDSVEEFTVVIPRTLATVTMSFFLGLLAPTVRKLGATEFRSRFDFQGPDSEELREELIAKALRTASPLRRPA